MEVDARTKLFTRTWGSKAAFQHPHHQDKAFESLNCMRKQNVMCDVVLVADGLEIPPCHKVVLCACSQYFYAMFTTNLAEAKAKRITFQEIGPSALVLLIDFVYSSEIQITEENVQTLLPAASMLQMTEVRDACCDFLLSQLQPSNALGIKAFADLHACSELFAELFRYEDFHQLPVETVCKVISSDRLNVTSEEKVFEAVLSWVNHDRSSRQEVISQLMENVRLPLMSQEYLVQRVDEDPLVKADSRCKDFLIEAMKYHLLKGGQKAVFQTPRTIPRNPQGLPKMMLVIEGKAPNTISSMECFDFKEGRWYQQLAKMPLKRYGCGFAVMNGIVYAIGGTKGSVPVRKVFPFSDVPLPTRLPRMLYS